MDIILNNKRINIKEAKIFFQRAKGLIGQTNINYGMLFKKCNSIHTFFMKENIDVLGLNEKNVVIYKIMNLEKNKIISIPYKLKKTSVLELPKNTSESIKIGDQLSFISK